MLRFVKLVGVEVEGGWKKPCRDQAIVQDVSVRATPGHEDAPEWAHFGELNSPPLELEKVKGWLSGHWPDAVNETCGFHSHVSVRDLECYSRMVSPQFRAFFKEKIKAWGEEMSRAFGWIKPDPGLGVHGHEFWRRLMGVSVNSRFCKDRFSALDQMWKRAKDEDRRTMINYPYTMHGTVECRLFPAFKTWEEGWEATKEWVDIVEEYLARPHTSKGYSGVVKVVGKVLMPNDEKREVA